jgi:DNA-binding transcriptional ArsR family regulator
MSLRCARVRNIERTMGRSPLSKPDSRAQSTATQLKRSKTMMTLTPPANPSNNVPRNAPNRCDESGLPSPLPLTDEQFARVARGLAHPTRVAIMRQLSDGEPRAAGDIVASTGLAQSTVSEHLRFLRDAQLLTTQKVGSRVWYCRRCSVVAEFAGAVAELGSD